MLHLAPISVAEALADRLFRRLPVVLVSATLGGGPRFAPFAQRVGLDPTAELGPVRIPDGPDAPAGDADDEFGPGFGYDDLEVESPFDFREQAMLYVARAPARAPGPGLGGRGGPGGA